MSELSRRHVCRLSSFALVSFFVAPQNTAWGVQDPVGSPQQIDGCIVAPLSEAWHADRQVGLSLTSFRASPYLQLPIQLLSCHQPAHYPPD